MSDPSGATDDPHGLCQCVFLISLAVPRVMCVMSSKHQADVGLSQRCWKPLNSIWLINSMLISMFRHSDPQGGVIQVSPILRSTQNYMFCFGNVSSKCQKNPYISQYPIQFPYYSHENPRLHTHLAHPYYPSMKLPGNCA